MCARTILITNICILSIMYGVQKNYFNNTYKNNNEK